MNLYSSVLKKQQDVINSSFVFAADREFMTTFDIEKKEKLNYWRSITEKRILPLDFSISKDEIFEGALSSAQLGPVILSLISASPHIVRRHVSMPVLDNSDVLVFNFVLSGSMIAIQDGNETLVDAGHATLVNASRSYCLSLPNQANLAVVQVPRTMIQRCAPGFDRVTAENLAKDNPVYPIVFNFIKQLYSYDLPLSPAMSNKLAENLVDLLGSMVFGTIQQSWSQASVSDHKAMSILRVKGHVETHLRSADLTPSSVAKALKISTRYINQLLSSEGISLGRYIWQQRLESMARQLRDPALANQSMSTLAYACGFNDMTHFSKAFSKKYEQSPSEYRKQHLNNLS